MGLIYLPPPKLHLSAYVSGFSSKTNMKSVNEDGSALSFPT
jgi:hypothetical protein